MRLPLALALLLFASCTGRVSGVLPPEDAIVDDRAAIIVIPGFYGSALRAKDDGRRVFLTAWNYLFSRDALSLFQDELSTPQGPELEVEGLLASVPVIPGIYDEKVYGPLVQSLKKEFPKSQVIPFSYDWRDDLSAAAAKLDHLVNALKEKHAKSISVVSHSLGGLVLEYYLAYGSAPPDKAEINWEGAKSIRRAVFMGTPFLGSMMAFRSPLKGSAVVRSNKVLPADAMASFPSIYEMLPPGTTLLDPAGAKLSVDLFDAAFWKKNHLGLLHRTTLAPSILERRAAFLGEWLAKARRVSDLLQVGHDSAWQPPASLRVLNIIGIGQDTLDSAYLMPDGNVLTDPDELKAAKLRWENIVNTGDGTVTMTSAMVPAALEASTKLVRLEGGQHSTLFVDPIAEKEYKEFLQ